MLSSASDQAKLFVKNFSRNSNLDDSDISLHLKLHNIFVTPKLVKKVQTNLDLSKMSAFDCIPKVVLNNYEPELSYTLAELFNICLKKSFVFEIVKRSHRWSLYLRMLGKVILLRTTTLLVSILWLVKSLKNL